MHLCPTRHGSRDEMPRPPRSATPSSRQMTGAEDIVDCRPLTKDGSTLPPARRARSERPGAPRVRETLLGGQEEVADLLEERRAQLGEEACARLRQRTSARSRTAAARRPSPSPVAPEATSARSQRTTSSAPPWIRWYAIDAPIAPAPATTIRATAPTRRAPRDRASQRRAHVRANGQSAKAEDGLERRLKRKPPSEDCALRRRPPETRPRGRTRLGRAARSRPRARRVSPRR